MTKRFERLFWDPNDKSERVTLARYVLENHPGIQDIKHAAKADLARLRRDPSSRQEGDAAFWAYISPEPRRESLLEVTALYERLQSGRPGAGGAHLTYVLEPPDSTTRVQRVRIADEVLWFGEGLCLEWTLLLAACVKAAGIFPLIVIADRHSVLGYWSSEAPALENSRVVIDGMIVREQITKGNIRLVNATRIPEAEKYRNIASGPLQPNHKTFEEAEIEAKTYISQIAYAVDIRAARERGIRSWPSPDPSRFWKYWQAKTAYIPLDGLDARRARVHQLPIDKLYITLTMQDQAEPDHGPNPRPESIELELGRNARPLQQVLQHARVTIVGDPGAGKTTFLRFIVNAFCKILLDSNSPVCEQLANISEPRFPLLVRMVELWKYINDNPGLKISRDAVGWLPAFLGRWCRDCITDIELNEDYFRWLLENQPCLLLIDGLDEIPYRVNREKVARLIENVALYFSKRCQVIVTSRQAAYDEGEVSLVGFTRALINPLRNSDIDQFLGHWSAAMNPLSVDLAKSYQRRPTDSGFATVGSRADQ